MNLASLLESLEKVELSPTSIVIACVALVIVTLLMMREFLTWMVKTNRVRQDIHNLSVQIQSLEERLKVREIRSPILTSHEEPNFHFPLETKGESSSSPTLPTNNL